MPFIGLFVEIEGPSEAKIQEIVSLLDLGANCVIRQSYGELIYERFKQLHMPLDAIRATFANEVEYLRMNG